MQNYLNLMMASYQNTHISLNIYIHIFLLLLYIYKKINKLFRDINTQPDMEVYKKKKIIRNICVMQTFLE